MLDCWKYTEMYFWQCWQQGGPHCKPREGQGVRLEKQARLLLEFLHDLGLEALEVLHGIALVLRTERHGLGDGPGPLLGSAGRDRKVHLTAVRAYAGCQGGQRHGRHESSPA